MTEPRRWRLEIRGMSCEHCVGAVRDALLAVPGVRHAHVRIGHAEVETDAEVRRDALATAIDELGYRVLD
ncbi:MAG: cation transporter [Myxococcota bacterium]|nr:cation transporter [Myxococcota bacterium]MDW8361970.1 cation transporter [Myxococcales bacterium]